ncbi:hypothetical protein [Shewanella woodyi]
MNRKDAELLLKTAIEQPEPEFCEGLWESIDALTNHNKSLLVV